MILLAGAILGKFGGCYGAARQAGENHRDGMEIGALMTSRGPMELIILNNGLQQKLVTIQVFTMMVLMALVTTVIAAPLFERLYRRPMAKLPPETIPAI